MGTLGRFRGRLIGAQSTTVLCACQAPHLRVAFAFGEQPTGLPLPSGAQWRREEARPQWGLPRRGKRPTAVNRNERKPDRARRED